jgi:hypothetical protein
MASGLGGPARVYMRILLWLIGAVILTVIALLIIMEVDIEKHGGGEMADGLALLIGLMLIAYYAILLFVGRTLLRRGGASWGWYLVAVMLLSVFVPPIYLWNLIH